MPTLKEAHGPEEDWSGLRDAKARRKLQNRLNVRAHRRRKALLEGTSACTATSATEYNQLVLSPRASSRDHGEFETQDQTNYWVAKFSKLRLLDTDSISLENQASLFPLSLDHLIPLVQYNFVRGVLTNMAILGLQDVFPPECARVWVNMPLFPAPSTIPESLQSTELQRNTPHEPWIDLIPDKQMRDNTILAMGSFAREDVEEDVAATMFGKVKLLEMSGLIAWNEPWRTEGWELTEGFIQKWPFLVKGCRDMLESTNRWRALRDEDPLVIEL
ncbi:uncharacterized protein F4822DRAFT_385543 [Hypoxylon trugodes]|uniref:uncharacterized protein n=1 Tax=Hypoxylon trugodes TaxID=326681 RepID=UPI002194E83E|nr:uncharacterized protein F4822DRAFT_385543 [Hypoxylon trugodes]KAI1393710.1 hypothetical protein F4822DRAFT_385543 [Hypoxylon trugodes]